MKKSYLVPLLFFVAAFPNLYAEFGSRGEAREAVVIQAMLEQRDYILPLRNGVEIPSKPPFFHWMGAVASNFFGGLSEMAVRLPSLLFSVLGLLFLARAVRRNDGENVAFLSVAICLTSFEWFRSSQLARVDMILAACLSGALWCLYDQWRAPSAGNFALLNLLLLGAFLSKGPAGLVLPFFILFLFLVPKIRSGELKIKPLILILLSAMVPLIAGSLWYYEAYLRHGYDFIETQLIRENFARLTGAKGYEVGHEKAFYLAPVDALIAFLPWSFALPFVCAGLYKRRKEIVSEGGFSWFCVSTVTVFLIVCMKAISKRPVYFLPVMPALAYLTACELLRFKSTLKRAHWFVAIILCLLAVGSYSGTFSRIRRNRSPKVFALQIQDEIKDYPGNLYMVKRDYFPLLFYLSRNATIVENSEQIPQGSYGIRRKSEGSVEICPDCHVLLTSENKADEGRGFLELIRKESPTY